MSACLQEAMKTVDLGVNGSGICNLFMVNEAEAAAMYALTSKTHQLTVCISIRKNSIVYES